ncbi:MAG: GNAT family N-acetyltransferase [Candidatus Eiseniibacteriota bacterium]
MSTPATNAGWAIRPLGADDAEAVRQLWASTEGLGVGPGDTPESLGRFVERNPGLSLVAVDAGRIVAAVLCGHDGRRGTIYRLAVAATHRRGGVATALVTRCLSGLRAQGIVKCHAFVLTDNDDAGRFWAAVGARARTDLVMHSMPT